MIFDLSVIIVLQIPTSTPIFQEICDVFFHNIINSTVILEGEDNDK